jgi:hypothetical protein
VYDGLSATPARYFLTKRSTDAALAGGKNASAIPAPATEDRWRLPADLAPFEAAAVMYNRAEDMSRLWVSGRWLQATPSQPLQQMTNPC